MIGENDLSLLLERLDHFLNDLKDKNVPINNGLAFSQVLLDLLNISHPVQRKIASDCCFLLFKTKFANYFTRNIDQMVNKKFLILNFFLI